MQTVVMMNTDESAYTYTQADVGRHKASRLTVDRPSTTPLVALNFTMMLLYGQDIYGKDNADPTSTPDSFKDFMRTAPPARAIVGARVSHKGREIRTLHFLTKEGVDLLRSHIASEVTDEGEERSALLDEYVAGVYDQVRIMCVICPSCVV